MVSQHLDRFVASNASGVARLSAGQGILGPLVDEFS